MSNKALGDRPLRDRLVVLRGAGDIATGVAWRLTRAGFAVIATELARPLTVRRTVSLSNAIYEGTSLVETMRGVHVANLAGALQCIEGSTRANPVVPVVVAPTVDDLALSEKPFAVVDARLAKRNIDSNRRDAQIVVGLGPGFVVGADAHAVVETNRGHHLGRVLWKGAAEPNTGVPGVVGGRGADRVLRAPTNGEVIWNVSIGDMVVEGSVVGTIGDHPIVAPFAGVVRGLIHDSVAIREGLKIGDIDPRCDKSACFEISDKALAIGGGVLEALLVSY
jgi:xanthine dehydrogenase accessory factor